MSIPSIIPSGKSKTIWFKVIFHEGKASREFIQYSICNGWWGIPILVIQQGIDNMFVSHLHFFPPNLPQFSTALDFPRHSPQLVGWWDLEFSEISGSQASCASKSSRSFAKTQIVGPYTQNFWFSRADVGPSNFHSNTFLDPAAGLGTTLWEALSQHLRMSW